MRYPAIIHKEEGSDYGVIVPDFPGTFSGGQTLEEALVNVQDAVETTLDGKDVASLPDPSPLEHVLALEEAQGGTVAFAEVSVDFLKARSCGMTRSGFLVAAAQAG